MSLDGWNNNWYMWGTVDCRAGKVYWDYIMEGFK